MSIAQEYVDKLRGIDEVLQAKQITDDEALAKLNALAAEIHAAKVASATTAHGIEVIFSDLSLLIVWNEKGRFHAEAISPVAIFVAEAQDEGAPRTVH